MSQNKKDVIEKSNNGGSICKEAAEAGKDARKDFDEGIEIAKNNSDKYAGTYIVDCALNMRKGPGKKNEIIKKLKAGEKIKCLGGYTILDGVKWLLVKSDNKAGYVSERYVTRE